MIKNVIQTERRVLNLKCEIFSKKFNFFSVVPTGNCGPLYSILSIDTMTGILGSFTHGLFKYEVEMVEMTPEEVDKNLFKKRRAVRRGSV
jgi:hypothetical protein